MDEWRDPMSVKSRVLSLFFTAAIFISFSAATPFQDLDPEPPDEVVKLVFVHHSCGENWLADGYGNLGRELGRNNYFVSDTNYGWGPDYIGDRTDIPSWLEWFRSPQTPVYMDALFTENRQHSHFTRTLSDPGGENQIVMFKSCFPNSELTGSPDDPPGTYEDLSVSGAKYVYKEILKFFQTRPDKLFIAITAPPLSDPTYSENARAFNNWLVNDWLDENNYTQNNVAVFDFYNILTDANAHHRYANGKIEHITGNRNTLAYPTGDDHPSEEGSRKATEEFIPLLNIYYNDWKENAPTAPSVSSSISDSAGEAETTAEAQPQPASSGSQAVTANLIDNFEADNPPGTNGWEPFWDEATPTSMHCASETGMANSGSRSLILDFDVSPNAWATCALFYENSQDFSAGEGLTFFMYANEPGLLFDVDVYAGSPEARETYLYTIESPAESAQGWVPFSLYWTDFHRADWEENSGQPFGKPDEITGFAFGMNTFPDAPNTGTIWIDDLSLLGSAALEPPQQSQEQAEAALDLAEEEPSRRFSLPCGSALALPSLLVLVGFGVWKQRLS